MVEFVVGVLSKFPIAKWGLIIGVCLIIWGDKGWAQVGGMLVGGVAVFVGVIALMLWEMDHTDKEHRNRK